MWYDYQRDYTPNMLPANPFRSSLVSPSGYAPSQAYEHYPTTPQTYVPYSYTPHAHTYQDQSSPPPSQDLEVLNTFTSPLVKLKSPMAKFNLKSHRMDFNDD